MLGVGISLTGQRRGALDVEDLAKGTVSLNFVAPLAEPTVQLNFLAWDFRAWVDDLSWPYGTIGTFKGKA